MEEGMMSAEGALLKHGVRATGLMALLARVGLSALTCPCHDMGSEACTAHGLCGSIWEEHSREQA